MLTALLMVVAGVIVIGILIAANGYFVAQEFSFMSVDRTQLRTLAASDDKGAQRALNITKRTSFMLSGAQLGVTVTGLLVGYAAEPLIGNGLGRLLGGTALAVGIGTVAALALSTIASMLFAELYPKNYTIAASMKSAKALSRSTSWYLRLFGPLIRFFEFSSNAILKIFGIEPVEDVDSSATTDDLESIVESSHETGDLDNETYMVLDRLLDFPDHDVEHAMIPRSRTDVVEPDTPIDEVRVLMAHNHSRYPVIDDEHNPVGVVHLIDVLATPRPDTDPVSSIMREALVVPELMPLPEVVNQLREHDEKMACVIDEYGGFVGIVTMEDLAEEILGDVNDEHDFEESEEIMEQDASHWLVDGDTPLDEIERAIGHDLPEGDFETVAGLLISETGGLMEVGEQHDIDLAAEPEDWVDSDEAPLRRLHVTVREIDRHVPSSLALELVEDHHRKEDD